MADTHIVVYVDESGEYRWRAVAANGETVADSSEGYVRRIDCVEMASKMFPSLTIVEQK